MRTVVGPPTDVIKKMGDKVAARQLVSSLGIPTIPGTVNALNTVQEAQDFADA